MSRVRSMRACGPGTGPTACALAGRRCSLWGWRKGVPGSGAFHRVVRGAWCQALSLPRPPVLWSGRPGFRDPCVLMDLKLKPELVRHKIRRRPYPAPKEHADKMERTIQECIDAGLVLEYKNWD